MHRSVAQSQSLDGARGGLDQRLLHLRGFAGGRYVNGLFEERPLEQVGFIEDGERLKPASGNQAFDRELAPRDIRFYLQMMFAHSPDAIKRAHEFGCAVGADYAPASG